MIIVAKLKSSREAQVSCKHLERGCVCMCVWGGVGGDFGQVRCGLMGKQMEAVATQCSKTRPPSIVSPMCLLYSTLIQDPVSPQHSTGENTYMPFH